MHTSSHKSTRFVSWLVLTCFYFQTLWPSVVFAADVEVMRPFPSLLAPKASYEPFFMRVLVDNNTDSLEDIEKESCPSSLIPISADLEETQAFIDASQSLQTLYKGLRVTEKGLLEWYDQGLCFSLVPGISGMNLMVSPQMAVQPSKAVRIFNPYGDVILIGSLEVQRLQVKGMNVGYVGTLGKIVELDVYVEEGKKFIVAENASLQTRNLHVHTGELENRGLLGNQDHFSITVPQIDNKGKLVAARGLSLSSRILNNTGRIYVEGEAEVKLDQGLMNADNALMVVNGNTFFSGPGKIHNKAIIQKRKVEGYPEELLTSGMIFNGKVVFHGGEILNEGTFFGEKIEGVLRKFLNHGSFEGKVFENLRVDDFTNHGIFQGSGAIHVTGDNWGELKGQRLIIDGNLTNKKREDSKGLVGATEELVLLGHFTNEDDANVLAPRLETRGDFKNEGIVGSEETHMIVRGKWLNALAGEVRADQIHFEEGDFLNIGSLTAKTFGHKSVFVNQGTLETIRWEQVLGGRLQNLPKSVFHVKGDLSLVRVLENQGKLEIDGAFTGDIDALHTTDLSQIMVHGFMDLRNSRSVTFRGVLEAQKGTRFKSKTSWGLSNSLEFQNYGTMIVKGHTDCDMALINYGAVDLESLEIDAGFFSTKFVNQGGKAKLGKIKGWVQSIENHPQVGEKTKPFDKHSSFLRIASGFRGGHIINGSKMTVERGDIFVGTLRALENSAFFHETGLFSFLHTYGDGLIYLDAFSFMQSQAFKDHARILQSTWDHKSPEEIQKEDVSRSLGGDFYAKSYRSGPHRLEEIQIGKKAKIETGNLRTGILGINPNAAFVLGKGTHDIDHFVNQGIFQAMEGMVMRTKKLDNRLGTILSEKALFVRALAPSTRSSPQYIVPYLSTTEPLIDVMIEEKDYSPGTEATKGLAALWYPGILQAETNIHVYLQDSFDIANVFHNFKNKWDCSGTLFLKSKRFLVRKDMPAKKPGDDIGPVELPSYALDIEVEDFQNLKYRLLARQLAIKTKTFKLGTDNDHLASIETMHVKETDAAGVETAKSLGQTNTLNITVTEGDLDTRYGQIFGVGTTRLTAEKASILVGDGKLGRLPGVRDDELGSGLYPERGWGHGTLAYPFRILNGAYIASMKPLFLAARTGQVLMHLGEIHCHDRLIIRTREFINRAGRVLAIGDVSVVAELYLQDILPTHHVATQYYQPMQKHYYHHRYNFPTGPHSEVKTQGRFDLKSPSINVRGGVVHAAKGIYNNVGAVWNAETNPFINLETINYMWRYWGSNGEGSVPDQIIFSYPCSVVSGEDIQLFTKDLRISGYLSGRNINISATRALLEDIGTRLREIFNPSIQDGARKYLGGPIQETAHGIGYRTGVIDSESAKGVLILGQSRPTAYAKAYYVPLYLRQFVFNDFLAQACGLLTMGGLSGVDLYQSIWESSQEKMRRGLLKTEEDIKASKSIVIYAKEELMNGIPFLMEYLHIPENLMDDSTLRSAFLRAAENLTMNLKEDLTSLGGKLKAGHKIAVAAKKVKATVPVARDYKGLDFHEHLIHGAHFMDAREVEAKVAEDTYLGGGVKVKGKEKVTLETGAFTAGTQGLTAHQEWGDRRQGGTHTETKHVGVEILCEGGDAVVIANQGSLHLTAAEIAAVNIYLFGQAGVVCDGVNDTSETVSWSTSSKKGFLGFGKSTTTSTSSSSSSTFRSTRIRGKEGVAVVSGPKAPIILHGVRFDTPHTILTALDGGVVNLLAGYNEELKQSQSTSKDLFWQKATMHRESHRTYVPCGFTGTVEIDSAEVLVEKIAGQVLEYLDRVTLKKGQPLNVIELQEIHDVFHRSVGGPSVSLGALIGLAVTIATSGTGAGLVGATEAVSCAMTNAAFTTLCSQAAVALVTHQGNIGRAAESLANTDTLKSLGVEVALAGLTGVGAKPDTFIGHFAQAMHKASYRMLVEKVVYGKTDEKGVALNALSSAVGTFISTEIGTAHYNGEIQGLAHKALHGISGGIQGWIVRGEKGIAPGALGALVAETVADVMTPTGGLGKVSASDKPHYTSERIQLTQNVARLTAGVAALLAGMDEKGVAIAISTATVAVENNFAKSAEKAGLETIEEEGEAAAYDTEAGYESDRTKYAREQVEDFKRDQAKRTELQREGLRQAGIDEESVFASTYAFKEREMAEKILPKEVSPEGLSPYEQQVLSEYRSKVAFGFALEVAPLGINKVLGAAKGVVGKVAGAIGGRAVPRVGVKPIGPERQLAKPKHTPYAGGFQRFFVTTEEEIYYRVYTGDRTTGAFLTKVPPSNAAIAREGLALPPHNSAQFIQEVLVPKGIMLQRSRALSAFGKRGAMEQFEVLLDREDLISKLTFRPGVPLL